MLVKQLEQGRSNSQFTQSPDDNTSPELSPVQAAALPKISVPTRRRSPAPPSTFQEPATSESLTPPPPSTPEMKFSSVLKSLQPSSSALASRSRTPTGVTGGGLTNILSPIPTTPLPDTGQGLSLNTSAIPRSRSRTDRVTPVAKGGRDSPALLSSPVNGQSSSGHFGSTRRPSTAGSSSDREGLSNTGRIGNPIGNLRIKTNPTLPPRSTHRPDSLLAATSTGSTSSSGQGQQISPKGVMPQRKGMF